LSSLFIAAVSFINGDKKGRGSEEAKKARKRESEKARKRGRKEARKKKKKE
jgi:hypothetical protein